MVEGLPSIERMGTTSAGTLFRLPAQPRDPDTIAGATCPSSYATPVVNGSRSISTGARCPWDRLQPSMALPELGERRHRAIGRR
jgi:hypothetical protein